MGKFRWFPVSGEDFPNKINPLNEYPNDGFRGIQNRTAMRSHPKWISLGLKLNWFNIHPSDYID